MPWQRHVTDVALEVDPVTGLLVYRQVVLTVPRQSGKTLCLLCLMTHRALGFGGEQRINYTAQTRLDARRKWEDDHVKALQKSPLRTMFQVRKQIGQEAIRWRNGSLHGITSTTDTAGHGDTLDLGVIDEAFAQDDSRIEQAMRPAMITRPQPQLWVVSTAGTERSAYLKQKVLAGRQRVELGSPGAVAYFEWSAPDEADPADPATWWACMPALGFTVTEDAVRAELDSMEMPDFRRAYLNQWPSAGLDRWEVVDREAWAGLVDMRSAPVDPVAFALDVAPEGMAGSIAVAGHRPDGLVHVEVADHRPGTGWMVARVVEMAQRWRPCVVALDDAGPAGALKAGIEAAGVDVHVVNTRELGQACAEFVNDVNDAGLRHTDQAVLTAALAGGRKRPLGDGAFAWSRKSSAVDISPLVAVTLARHVFGTHRPAPAYDLMSSVQVG